MNAFISFLISKHFFLGSDEIISLYGNMLIRVGPLKNINWLLIFLKQHPLE